MAWCEIADASQPCLVVVGDEGVEIGVAFGVICEAPVVSDVVLWQAIEMFAETAVEALDHAIGLRVDFR